MPAFSKSVLIRFRDCDPAGILFFGRPYEYAHDCFEDFVSELGYTSKEWFGNPDFGTPVRQSSCEYFKPMRVGETVEVKTWVENIGDSAFTLKFSFQSTGATSATQVGREKHCEVTLVLVCIDFKAFKKMSLPSKLRERLEAYKL